MALRSDKEIIAALGPFILDARAGLDQRIALGAGAPDLQDAVERAHALDEVAVPQAVLDASRQPSLLPDASAMEVEPGAESRDFAAFLADVGGQVESWGASRDLAPAPTPPRRRRLAIAIATVGGLLAAAAVLVGSGALQSLGFMVSDPTADPSSAEMWVPPAENENTAAVRRPRARSSARAPSPVEEDAAADDAVPEPPPRPDRVPRPAAAAHGKKAAAPSLHDLDARAQVLWRSGDVAGAEKALGEVVRRGGKSKYAELAFGDLMALAHRNHRTKRQTKLWQRYLARFPRGRYADDARAGLCRRAPDSASCWRAYLADWPRGSHRAEARRASERERGEP